MYKEFSMSNNVVAMSASSVYDRRPALRVQNIDPASNRANHGYKWELAAYLRLKAGDGRRVPVRKRPYKRDEMSYTYGPLL